MPAVAVERATGYGENAFRVVVPPAASAVISLQVRGAETVPEILAWAEAALIEHNRQTAVLSGVVSGLLAAAAAFALGAAVLSGTRFSRWAAVFLLAVLIAQMSAAAMFDGSFLTLPGGPHALFALAIAATMAAGLRLLDRIAPFEGVHPDLPLWRDRAALALLAAGIGAYAGAPYLGLALRVLAVAAAAASAAYLVRCARAGNTGARRLAPAATVFALVAAAAACNALGLFGTNLVASGAIGGFSAAGALLVAIATAVPFEPAERKRELLEPRKLPVAVQHAATDNSYGRQREHLALSASHQGVFDLDLTTGLVSLSAEAAQILGLPSGAVELSRETWLDRIHPEDRDVYRKALETYRRDPGIAFRLEFRAQGAGGRMAWFELRATMTGQSTEAERCLGLIANVTARKSAEIAEVAPAPSDPLTGLGTRAALLARLDALRAELKVAALAVFDLDRFKSVNESLGHDNGDKLLIALAGRLTEGAAAGNGAQPMTFFRVGGDMFAALAQEVQDLKGFGQRLVHLLGPPFAISGREIYLPASVGVAAGEQAEEAQDLLAQAELAMVEAKREGGSRALVYSDALLGIAPNDPIAIESDIRLALERNEIEVHYQPIVRLQDGVVAGFEALLRWRHPERGVIEPESFIPQAERSGLIVPLGRLALERAIADLARWQKFFPAKPPLFVSVNVAWRQIAERGFAKDLALLLKRAGLANRSLRLEVTESQVMAGSDRAEAALKHLKHLGAGLAIDDFGTGHSSLSHLARFPFDTIKIDKSFISDAQERTGSKILASIVSLAHDLKLSVVAEGVENEGEAARLKEMACEFGQGFLFGSPMPAKEVSGLISAGR